jgi:hypothetical protein
MNWHILDPLGGEDWLRFMCGVENFSYVTSLPRNADGSVSFTIPGKNFKVCITTGQETLRQDTNWYRIHNLNSESSPFIQIGRTLILPEQKNLAMRYFEHLTGLTLTF